MTVVSILKRLGANLFGSGQQSTSKKPCAHVDPAVKDLAAKLADGNAGAYLLMMSISDNTGAEALELIEGLDEMGLRGSSIWGGYKRHCKENLDAFIQAIRSRDAAMVRTALNR